MDGAKDGTKANVLDIRSVNEKELISVILGEGTQAFMREGDTLKHFSNLDFFARSQTELLNQIKGMNPEKALKLLAALELGWRTWMKPEPLIEPFRASSQVYHAFKGELGREEVEVVWLLLLDTRLRQMTAFEIARGALNGAIVHPREVFFHVITRRAAAFILMHNHPSGDPTPSLQDLSMTRKILRLSRLLEVDFLDHIIFTAKGYYSLCDKGRMG